jgi:hypothetical protein
MRIVNTDSKRCPETHFVREKFTREQTAARKLAEEYFQRYPKNRYQTEVESWRNLQSANIVDETAYGADRGVNGRLDF